LKMVGPCSGCGTRIEGGTAGCRKLLDELTLRRFREPSYARLQFMIVDIYALQHPDGFCASAKSLAAHLCGLCIAQEQGDGATARRALQAWLSNNPRITKPPLPGTRGSMTIADVTQLDDASAFSQAVDSWAHETWEAYAALHAQARDWIKQAYAMRPRK